MRVGQLVFIIVVFVILGPLIGLVIFSIMSEAYVLAIGTKPGNGLFLFIPGLLFAHLVGAIPAAMAGLLVALIAAIRRNVPLWMGFGVGLVVGTILAAYVQSLPSRGEPLSTQALLGFTFLCAVASAVCTYLTRRWQ